MLCVRGKKYERKASNGFVKSKQIDTDENRKTICLTLWRLRFVDERLLKRERMQYLNYIMLLVGVTENERQRDREGESERKVYVV